MFCLNFDEVGYEMADCWRRVILVSFALGFLMFGRTLGQQFLVSRDDRFALLQLRSSLGLRAKEWGLKSDPCTSWVGVQCSNGRVVGINISGFRRSRIGRRNPQFSMDALQNLTFLSTFNASNFALPGRIPHWFGLQLASLQVLDLRSCSVNGSIPPTLGNLSSLVELYLSDNNLIGSVPSRLGQLSRLSVIDLSLNSLTGLIPETFGSLGNLSILDLSSNFLSGSIPPSIGLLSTLQVLNLSRNSLLSSIPAEIGNLSSLIDLDVGFNTLSGSVPRDLRNLTNLRRMLMGNNFLSGSLPRDLFSHLSCLQILFFCHNNFSGNFPDILWLISSMHLLDASANNLTGLLPNANPSVKSGATVYNISQNLLYGKLTPVIGGFSSIDLSGNYFEGQVPDYARGNTSLMGNCIRNLTYQRNRSDCASFYGNRNLVFDNFGESNTNKPHLNPSNSYMHHHRLVIILASILGGIGVIALVLSIVGIVICTRRNRGMANQRGATVGHGPLGDDHPPPIVELNFSDLGEAFTYEQILQFTRGFNEANLIKHGHSGDLFRGIVGGIPVVIKKVDLNASTRKEAYMYELDTLCKICNPKFIPLLGHCLEKENEKYLIYKHMPNGDLSSSLFKKRTSDDDSLQSLDWITRLKIAIGVAEALTYLHHECSPPLVHRDIQASSILLDDKYEVRLGSLSEVCPQESDAHQTRISRFLRLPQTSSDQGASGVPNATCAHDVYCFGKVLLELVTGRLDISSSTDVTTNEWLEATLPHINIYDKELVTKILDPSLIIDEDLLEEVWAMAIVARSCLNPKPNRRPLMRYILKALENPLKVVREEHIGSSRLRTTSSRGSWNATLFGSWRHISSDVATVGPSHKVEGTSNLKHSATTGSQGSGPNGDGNGHSSSLRRQSNEIFPEPLDEHDLERANIEYNDISRFLTS